MFGTSGRTLAVFDLNSSLLLREIRMPSSVSRGQGEWVGGVYYLYAYDDSMGYLWRVTAETTELGAPARVRLPPQNPTGVPIWHVALAAGDRLIVYEMFGMKIDRRRGSSRTFPGGALVINPETGEVIRHIQPGIQFLRVVSDPAGEFLWAVDSPGADRTGPVRLLKISVGTGEIVAERRLDPDNWDISFARLPTTYIPRGAEETKRSSTGCTGREF
jgi:hypothetical protein